MSKFSVKRPFTVLVGVIMVLILGVISFTESTTDLLPEMELPYVVVYTTDIGASAQKVESEVTKILESALGTTENLANISSISNDNLSLIILEFNEDTNMDSTMIEINSSIEQIRDSLDENASTPIMMKLNPNMIPIMMASVDMDGKELGELSDFVSDTLTMQLEKIEGVAEVSVSGLLEETVQIRLDQAKIDEINYRLTASVNETIAEQEREVRQGLNEINDALAKIEDGESALESSKSDAIASLAGSTVQLQQVASSLIASNNQLIQYNAEKMAYQGVLSRIKQQMNCSDMTNEELAAYVSEQVNTLKAISAIYERIDAWIIEQGQENEIIELDDAARAALEEIIGPFEILTYGDLKKLIDDYLLEHFQIEASMLSELSASLQSVSDRINDSLTGLNNLDIQIQTAQAVVDQTKQALSASGIDTSDLNELQKKIEEGKLTAAIEFGSASSSLSNTKTTLQTTKKQLEDALSQIEKARDEALKAADISGVLTPAMISNILMAENFSMPAGYIASNDESILLKVGDEFASLEEVEDLLLSDIEGVGKVYLKDISEVVIVDNSSELYTKVNGNDGIIISFQKSSTASTATVCKSLNKAFENLMAEYDGLHITALFDQGIYIDMVVDSVLDNFLQGGVLAILVLLLFLKDVKPTIVIGLSIPISLLFAIVLMYFSNISLNIISLSGLALGIGMLVDNSIVVLENIYRRHAEGEGIIKASIQGAKQVSGSIIASTLTTVCVFLPIVFASGIAKQLFTDMGLTIAYSLAASLIVALTLVPMLCSKLLKRQKKIRHPWFDRFQDAYERILKWSLAHKAVVLITVTALFGFCCYEVTQMGMSLIPSMDSGQISLSIALPEDNELSDDEKHEIYNDVMDRLLTVEGIETVGTTDSTGLMMSSMASGNTQTIYIVESAGANQAQVAADIQQALADLESCTYELSTSNMDMTALYSSGITMNLYGDDLDELRDTAIMLKEKLEEIEGVSKADDGQSDPNKELRITVSKNKAMEYGLTVAQVYMSLASDLSTSTKGTTLTIMDKSYPVVVVSAQDSLTVEDLDDYVLETDGKEVRLSDIAEFKEDTGMASISRSNQRRYVSVSAQIEEGYNVSLVSREVEKIISDIELPKGISLEFDGENETIMSTMWELLKMIALAVVFIYMIMVAQFQSLLSPFIVMFTIPLAFTGGILALLISSQELSIIAMLGFLILCGVVVNNGIVFIDTANQYRREGMDVFEALIVTGRTRLRPILMTAMTTILALITMALGIGSGSQMMQGMGIVVIGGLSYATILTLIVIPVLYSIMNKKPLKQIEEEDYEVI